MNEVIVVEADMRIREAAAQACSEHDEATYLMTHRTEISAIHEYNRTSLHSTIFQIFRENHGSDLVTELQQSCQGVATVVHKSPLILLQGGIIESEANETLIIIPLGYISTYPSTPKPATGCIVADRDGYYEPVILALSTLSGNWSILKWKTGTYIRVPPGSHLKVESGIVFFLLLSINLQPFHPGELALTAPQ
ncbi:hypothetical protein BKA56DRAFT_608827 [Ilyonectria sp. MPI-CAGE-AT-0026]|nr:hypothetical protein BKA56DRAFT_608827 [Ilyonectria sp. MPI-CAGE-AT-0026]